MTLNDLKALVRPNILKLSPYSTARDEFTGKLGVFLDANESPYDSGWNRYPDPRQLKLKEMISEIKGIATDRIFIGNGSDEAIDLMFRVFCIPGRDNAVAISPSYGMYRVSSDINDVEMREVLLEEDTFSLPLRKILDSCDEKTKLLFLCSPNNPSGNAFPKSDIKELIEKFKGIVVLDEAYVDFSEEGSLLGEIDNYPNLVVLQTNSKARGLAALRLGMAFSNEFTIRLMSMVKYPYNINEAAQKLALEALKKDISGEVAQIKSERKRIAKALSVYPFVKKVYPSDANFLLVKVDDADRLYDHLTKDGIIVRNRNRMPLCAGCLRITTGLPQENDKLLKSLENYE